jgi:hypothetical protein
LFLVATQAESSVGGWKHLRLHELHRRAATLDLAVSWLDAEHLATARFALESLAQLVCHGPSELLLLLHGLAAAGELPVARLRDDHFSAAFRALIAFAYLVCQCPLLTLIVQDAPSAS